MIIKDFDDKYNKERIVVGLGYFDSVHKGHTYLIEEVKSLALRLNAIPAVFTFSTSPFGFFGRTEQNIFSFDERVRRLDNLDVKMIIGARASKEFFDLTATEFLDRLTSNFDVVGMVSGTDYTYGRAASGNEYSLLDYGKSHNILVSIVDLVKASGKKIASRDIRELLLAGEISAVNDLLSEPYSLSGTVKKGRNDGSKIGFPTANVDIEDGTLIVKNGVYSSIVIVDNVRYKAVTNIGGHPTFGDDKKNIEPYIIDFDGNLYGKNITIIPVRWLRGVKKFDSVDELRRTIANDELTTRREIEL